MISRVQLEKLITNIEQEPVSNLDEIDRTTNAKLEILYWVYNNKNLKTPEEIKIKVTRLEEETIPLEKTSTTYMETKEKISTLKMLLT